jgi:ABC-2 type transport system ATP-binding protein
MELFARFLVDSSKKGNEKIKFLLEQMVLWERSDDKVSAFSKGMKQRLAIARSLINDPQLLIMDEPLSALDPESHKIIIEFIRKLNQNKNMTILITSHNLYDIENLCSHVGILNHGILVAADTISNLRSRREVNLLDVKIGSINPSDLQHLLDKISEISAYTFLSNDTVQLSLKKDCQAHSVIGQLALNQIPVREVREVGNSLEDIYMEIVKKEVPDNE